MLNINLFKTSHHYKNATYKLFDHKIFFVQLCCTNSYSSTNRKVKYMQTTSCNFAGAQSHGPLKNQYFLLGTNWPTFYEFITSCRGNYRQEILLYDLFSLDRRIRRQLYYPSLKPTLRRINRVDSQQKGRQIVCIAFVLIEVILNR